MDWANVQDKAFRFGIGKALRLFYKPLIYRCEMEGECEAAPSLVAELTRQSLRCCPDERRGSWTNPIPNVL